MRIVESNGNTWLAADGKSFINAKTGERLEGEVKLEKDGTYKFVLESGKEISRNTDNSTTFSDRNGSVTINSDNSKLVKNSNGALILVADAAGRVTKLEPVDREADEQPSKVTLPNGKVWERVDDNLWKEPDAKDPITGEIRAGDTMNGSFKLANDGNLTLDSERNKESITFKTDGSIVTRNDDGKVISVEDKFGRAQKFTYKNDELIGTQDYDGSNWTKVSAGVWAKEGTSILWKGERSLQDDGTLRLSTEGKELTRRTNGWEEHKDTSTGKSSFQTKTPDNAIVVKDNEGKITELRFANGDFRKFGYDKNGAINKVTSRSGEVLSSSDGINWRTESKPSEAARQLSFEVSEKGVFRELSNDGKSETVHKGDGSVLRAVDGRLVEIVNPQGETRKLVWDESGELKSIEESSAGRVSGVWRKTGEQSWQKETSSGKPLGDAMKGEFALDAAGNIQQKLQTGKDINHNIFKTSGEILHVESGIKETPQKDGSRTFSNERGQIIKVADAAGKVTEFGYDENNRLNLIRNNAGTFKTENGLQWKAEGAVKKDATSLIPGNGIYEVLRDGTIKESLAGDKVERFHKTDGKTVVKEGESLRTLDSNGRIVETVDSKGEKTSFEYGTLKRMIGGKEVSIPDQLCSVKYANGETYSTTNGLDWKSSKGQTWTGVITLKKDGTLQSIDTAGNEIKQTLDGKTIKEKRLDLLAKVDDSFNMMTHTWGKQAKWSGSSRADELDKKFTGLPAAEVQLLARLIAAKFDSSKSPDEVLKPLIGEGHSWEKVLGHLSRADEANLDKVAGDDAAAIRTAITERGQIFGDRSSEGCEKAIRMTLQKMTHEQIEKLCDEYKRRYGDDLKSVLKDNPYFSEFTKKSIDLYMKGSDQISSEQKIAHMVDAFNSRNIDHLEESCLRTTDAERKALIDSNGGYAHVMSLAWSNYGGLTLRDAMHAREALMYGGQTEAQKIRDSVGFFSNDQETIEKVLKEMPPERREMFFQGEYLESHKNEIKTDADKRANEFYLNMSLAFNTTSSDMNWNKSLRIAQLKDQVSVAGGGLMEKLGDHKGFWTDARKDVVKTVQEMGRSEWDSFIADPKYLDRLEQTVGAAMGANNFAPVKEVLQAKIDFKTELDKCSSKELKEKFDHFKNMSDSDREKYVAGRALAQNIQQKSLDENGQLDPLKLAKLENELKGKAASGDNKAQQDLQMLEMYKNETFKAVRDGARRSILDSLEDTRGDAKAGIDMILKMTPAERSKDFKGTCKNNEEFQEQLKTKIESVFGKDTAAHKTAMNLLEQIRSSDSKEAPKLSTIDKLNMMAYDNSRKDSDVVRAIEESFREDPSLRDSLKTNPKLAEEFRVAAVAALKNIQEGPDSQETYNKFIKPLIENGHLTVDQLLRVNSHDQQLFSTDRDALNKHLLTMAPEAFHKLSADSKELEALSRFINPEDRKVLANMIAQADKLVERRSQFLNSLGSDSGQRKVLERVLAQGGPRSAEEKAAIENLSKDKVIEFDALIKDWQRGTASASDEMRMFVLGAGVDAHRVKTLLADLDLDQRKQLLQEYADKYGMRDLKRDILDHAANADRPELEYLLRTTEYSAGLKLNQVINQVSTSDGISSSLMRYTGYGGALTEFRQDAFDMHSEVASAAREGRHVDEKLIDDIDASFRESLVNFREAKEQFADSIVNTALTAAALSAAPFTGGASLAPILYGMAAGAALKVGTHYMVSGADFEMSVGNISRKMASGMVEGGFAMVNPAHLGAIGGLGKAAAGQAAMLSVKELNTLGAALGSKALSEAGEKMLQSEMKTLVATALANRVAGVSEKELARLAEKVVAKEFGNLAEAQAKVLAAKLTESLSKNLQQAIVNETKTFLLQAQKEAIHLAANASIGAGSAISGTLVDQAFSGRFDGAALMQTAGEGAAGGLFGSAIGRGFHGAGQLRNIDEAGALTRMSFAALQAVGSGLGGDALAQGSVHGSVDFNFDSIVSTLMDASSGAKDAGRHGGPSHLHKPDGRRASHEASGNDLAGEHAKTKRPISEGNVEDSSRKSKEADESKQHRSENQIHSKLSEDSPSDRLKRLPRNEVDELVNKYCRGEGGVSRNEVQEALRKYGIAEMKRMGFGDKAAELMTNRFFGIEEYNPKRKTLGGYSPEDGDIKLNLGRKLIADLDGNAVAATKTATHEIRHRLNAFERTALAKAFPEEYRRALVEEVVQHTGKGGLRTQPPEGLWSKLVSAPDVNEVRMKAQPAEINFMTDALRKYLTQGADASMGKPTTVAGLQKWLDNNNLKMPGTDVQRNNELLKEMIGEIAHANLLMNKAKLQSTVVANGPLKDCLDQRVDDLRKSSADSSRYIEKYVRGLSLDFAGINGKDSTVGKEFGDEYYLFSVEEVRARRTQHAAEVHEILDEVRNLIKDGPEDGKQLLLRIHQPETGPAVAKWTLGSEKAMEAYLSKLRVSDPARAKAIESRLAETEAIFKKIQFNNALEDYQKHSQELNSFSDPHLLEKARNRMVVQEIDGKKVFVKDTPELAEARRIASIDKLMASVSKENVPKLVSHLYDRQASAEQLMKKAPKELAGEVAATLYLKDRKNCDIAKLLNLSSSNQMDSVVSGLLNNTDLTPGELIRDVSGAKLAQVSASLLKQAEIGLNTVTQLAINNNRLDEFVSTGLASGTLSVEQLRGLVAERTKNGSSLQETQRISALIDAWTKAKLQP